MNTTALQDPRLKCGCNVLCTYKVIFFSTNIHPG